LKASRWPLPCNHVDDVVDGDDALDATLASTHGIAISPFSVNKAHFLLVHLSPTVTSSSPSRPELGLSDLANEQLAERDHAEQMLLLVRTYT